MVVIDQSYLNECARHPNQPGPRLRVHVEGWDNATVFLYRWTDANGVHFLETTKGKQYRTANRLLFTRRDEPSIRR